ncbi:PaaX family transcriptional regulator C-terminal domain-containing protein [Paracoccus marinaquae]|uniref:ArsR family transcriptional regulator n=1 Tax=Paracoccus marinaquae TaxID=2841926 RepID=A0ABS6AG21_9RHOB|nr:PaaX family transcriptional regulator C-terminal domain-containing protein [Paracoccus marinaquae]MBU3029449.1 ArsR family transcriptional regulator [Paracoccus marinaquae]
MQALSTDGPPRASSFIVTIYGDVVEPRGGVLWMGTLIDCCAGHGISESLVRTAVSRLVGAGRLEGQRIGRKSYYRLSAAGRAEFRRASRILFAPPVPAEGWLIALPGEDAPLPDGWVRLAAPVAMAPGRKDISLPKAPVMAAQSISGVNDLPGFAARHWPLAEVAQTYQCFVARFRPVGDDARDVASGPADALALRLRLVDEFRHAALADPRLPPEALPPDWPAPEARDLFRRIYLALSPAADRHVGRHFADSRGLLAEMTGDTAQRYADLRE